MKIKKINISGFGKFEDRQFGLEPGMNIFYGCNEAGKSTLQSFIRGMLYGLKGGKRTKDGVLPPVKQYKPWTAKAYGGSLEYELDNGSKYTIIRNFDRNTVTVYDEYSNNITGNFPASREEGVKFAEQHLGLSEGCFERTVFIGQLQSIINSEGKKVIAERLTNIKQTGDEEVSFRKAMDALKQAQMTYVGSERTTTRPLNIISARLQEAIEEEQQYIKLHNGCMDMFLELEQLREKENHLKTKLNNLNLMKEKTVKKIEADKLENIRKSLKNYHKRLEEIEKEIGSREEELNDVLARLKEYEAFGSFSGNAAEEMVSDYTNYILLRKELEKLETESSETERKIREIQNELQQYAVFSRISSEKTDEVIQEVLNYNRERAGAEKQEKQSGGSGKYISAAGLVLGIIIILASFVIRPYNSVITTAGLLISVLTGILLLIAAKRGKMPPEEIEKRRTEERKYLENAAMLNKWMEEAKADNIHDFIRLKNIYEDKTRRLNELLDSREKHNSDKTDILKSIEAYEARILDRLVSANLIKSKAFCDEDVRKWKKGLETYNTLVQKEKDLKNVLASLNQTQESIYREASVIAGSEMRLSADLEKEIDRIGNELETLKASADISPEGTGSLTPDEIDPDIKRVNEELNDTVLNINTLSTRLENIPDGEMIQKAHEKVMILTKQKDKKLFLGKALETAMEVLGEASVDLQRNYSPYLNEAIGKIVDKITGGRYSDVMADDSLRLNIQPPGIAEKVVPEQLSSGTADQVYFALRLATVMLIENGGETLPLFLDDPFVQYDEERTANALKLLSDESKKRQIILFTCKKREVELAERIFDKEVNIINL